ncbi:hydroxymethylbilane synthase [Methanobrevibacter curvatus]|uniref:hydroxymethylbilane synthase n=1 Tax=Methanobrevibacter curvatus TaxID=49547 RepID=UPI000833A138|nr:hydroxymethylbilane synthase [Methanobrevibacter curvatus]
MIIGSRGSKLAITQANLVKNSLSEFFSEKIDMSIIKTKGDKITNSQLYDMDSKGLFTKELDKAVLEEEVDFAVHSLKDVPTDLDEDLQIISIPERVSPNEVFISNYLWDEIPKGSTLGSSSLRREAFSNFHKKELVLKPLRGNIETRINKVFEGEVDGTIMAEAGLIRLGLTEYIKNRFSTEYLTPPAGQGALAIIARRDSYKKNVLFKLNHFNSFQETFAEKTLLHELGVGCQWPLGANAKFDGEKLSLYAVLLSKEGEILSKVNIKGSLKEAQDLGILAAKEMKEFL